MSDGISAQGTILARQNLGTGAFSNVAELKDITPPVLSRNEIELTNHNDTEDSAVVGIKRRGTLDFEINYLPGNASHDEVAGLTKSWNDGQKDGWRITFPDTSTWIFSGYITNISPSAPVDGALTANISVKPTNTMAFAGV